MMGSLIRQFYRTLKRPPLKLAIFKIAISAQKTTKFFFFYVPEVFTKKLTFDPYGSFKPGPKGNFENCTFKWNSPTYN